MLVNVMNKAHFNICIGPWTFKPYEEIIINVGPMDFDFKMIRGNPNLRVGKLNNAQYIKKHKLYLGSKFNFAYDDNDVNIGFAYKYAIEALADPIIKYLPKEETAYYSRPVPGKGGKGLNCRFFSSLRINQQGKTPVGPRDIFISHGIGDKNYWIGPHIQDYKYAFCPGPAWENRMKKTGYKGEIFQVGYTKLDPLFNGEYVKNSTNKIVVAWLPTHGYNNKHRGRSSFPMFSRFVNQIPKDYQFVDGMHPTTKLHNKEKNYPTMQLLIDADVVIADAGSTVYEAWALGKPVVFPDWICKDDVLGHFKTDKNNLEYIIYNKSIGYHANNMKELNKMIEIAASDGMQQQEIELMESIFPNKLRGKSGETAARALNELY